MSMSVAFYKSIHFRENKSKREVEFGIPLLDFLSIVYLGKEKVKPEDQRGLIKIHSQDGDQFVYNVDNIDDDKTSMSTIQYMDDIPVTAKGPYWADNHCMNIDYDLFNGAYKGNIDIYQDLQTNTYHDDVDEQVLCARDRTGKILVNVGAYRNATVANVEIRLLSDGSGHYAYKNVYGVISASNSFVDFPSCSSVLFAKKEDQGIDLQPDGVIPLLKASAAVPLGYDFYVDIGLKVNGLDVKASKAFTVCLQGEFQNITDDKYENPHVQVKVWGDASVMKLVSKYDIVSDAYTGIPWDD